ncbi:hypothetical protein L0156_25675 [bacterium]|nr:hypothetical protein [bacterium]
MKIDSLRNGIIQDEPTEKTESTPKPGKVVDETPKEPVQLQRPLPKADSVEIKENSTYLDIITAAPKLDPSQINLAATQPTALKNPPLIKEDPKGGLIPGVPFREKVELPKTLPDGESVDTGLGSDLGMGRTRTGPNRMGVDMGVSGIEVRNQLDDALKLRQGSQSSSNPSGGGTYQPVVADGTGNRGNFTGKADGIGPFDLPGRMDLISAEKGEKGEKSFGEKVKETVPKIVEKIIDFAKDVGVDKFGKIPGTGEGMTILDAPAKVKEVTGDEKDLVRGIAAVLYPESRLDQIEEASNDKEYVNPEGDQSTVPPQVTDEAMEKVLIREGANTKPSNEDTSLGGIDGSKLTAPKEFDNLRLKMMTDPLPENENAMPLADLEKIQVMHDAKGPDTINPDQSEGATGEKEPLP